MAQLPPQSSSAYEARWRSGAGMAEAISAALEKEGRAVLQRAQKIRGQRLAPAVAVEALLDSTLGSREKFDLQVHGKSFGKCVREQGGAVKISLLPSVITDESIDFLVEVLRAM